MSHIYPIFPGTEVQDAEDKALMEYFEKAVYLRESGSFCGWSMPHMSAIYSRLKNPEKAFYALNALAKVCLLENFFTLGHDYRDMGITGFDCGDEYKAHVQLDALLSFINAVQEMLLFVSEKTVKILPSCPNEFGNGSATLHFKDGVVTMNWDLDEHRCNGTIKAVRDTEFKLELPFESKPISIKLSKDEIFEF